MLDENRSRYNNISLDNAKINMHNSELINFFKDYIKDIVNNINNCKNVIITGSVGVGKTYITKSFINDLKKITISKKRKTFNGEDVFVKDNVLVKYITVSELISELRKKYKNETVDPIYFNCDILVIDEIGIQFGTDAERQILFELINYRYDHLKPIFLISNYPLRSSNDEKGLYFILGQRIMDRVADYNCAIFSLTGTSFRQQEN